MTLTRRSLLQSIAAGAAAAPFLGKSVLAAALKKVRVQIGWIANAEYAGLWVGLEKNYFKDAGLDVSVTPGGPNAPDPLVVVAGGEADIGYTSWLPFLDAVAKGNDYVLFAAGFQSSPLGIISLARKPILTAKDLVGARILAQGPNEKTSIDATLALAGLPKDWTMVPTGFSPEPLVAGDGDGYTAFATNQTITLEKMGLVRDKDFFFRSFDELGFKSYAELAFCTRDYLAKNRQTLVDYVKANIKAYRDNEKDPAYAAKLAVDKYGADYGLDLEQQTRLNELQIPIIRPNNDPSFKILTMNKDEVTGPMYAAAKASGRTNLPDVDKIFDFSIAEEAHASL
ncbi:ABC-type nitrate/sulfonate/bicarbonate transport system, substrate-binding protein [Faunimonas pinastri]|uniref:ABC-type nitrate/sulfonate/bicarbonate transport system, substrate-binding protein n=1 Tax=Faunimonas pinastri TaxID=1855383 RepID=A0A1H9B382_9HYPH|nr:ABC transporter substrate-binding protein [Faunimonas pinastri]SEP82678.1 ABC-type nitrate/sulfonate/bicarbonate transport system, substrate-binding protein [Faunimonas pinastri]